MRIGSLFSGIGGLELGLEWAGVGHTVWQVEQDAFCLGVMAHHWPDAQRFTDVREVGAHSLAPVDVICGGFPCQDISYAGKGAGLAGHRSGLWTEFARIIGELGPRYVVVENVRALLTRGIDQVLGTLADLGYDAEWSIVSAASVGAPHRRERVFIVAYRHGAGVGDAQGERWAGWENDRDQGGRKRTHRPAGASLGDTDGERGCGRGVKQDAGDADTPGEVVRWGDAVPVRGHDGTVRLIPADAAARGLESPLCPVAYGVPGRVAGLRALGNAVVPQCSEVVGRRLMQLASCAPVAEST